MAVISSASFSEWIEIASSDFWCSRLTGLLLPPLLSESPFSVLFCRKLWKFWFFWIRSRNFTLSRFEVVHGSVGGDCDPGSSVDSHHTLHSGPSYVCLNTHAFRSSHMSLRRRWLRSVDAENSFLELCHNCESYLKKITIITRTKNQAWIFLKS